jgi:hypothetical protein
MAKLSYLTTPPARPRLIGLGLLVALVLVGAALFRGYGIGWDEFPDHNLGNITANYIAVKLTPARWQHLLPTNPEVAWLPTSDVIHGPVVETPAAILGHLLYPNQPWGYYTVRHGFVFLVFVAGVLALYGLSWLRFRDWRLALLGAGLLVLSPRFFAEAFYNGKDVGFMALFTVAMLAVAWLTQRPTTGRALLCACATGAAIGVRMPGILLPAFTIAWLGWLAWLAPTGGQRLRLLGVLGLYAVASVAATILWWPYLWESPLVSFRYALGVMSRVPWPGTVLYWGKLIPAPALPWHYIPVWILITTPLSYVLAALVGLGAIFQRIWQQRLRYVQTWSGQFDCIVVAWLVGPVLAIVVFHSVVFDGWRHMYFVYPGLLLLAVRGVQALGRAWQLARQRSPQWPRWLLTATLVVMLLDGGRAAWFIASAYPNQQVYFSCVPAATAERLFERDYWGLSYRYGLEWLLSHDPSPVITVTGPQASAIYVNQFILSPAQQKRIKLTNNGQARYYLTAYRWHPQPYADSLGPEVLAYRPGGGIKALSIFRRDSLNWPLPPKPIGVGHRP